MILEIIKHVKQSKPCGLKAIFGSFNNKNFPFLESYFLKRKTFKNQRFLPCVLTLLASNFMLSTLISCINSELLLLNKQNSVILKLHRYNELCCPFIRQCYKITVSRFYQV